MNTIKKYNNMQVIVLDYNSIDIEKYDEFINNANGKIFFTYNWLTTYEKYAPNEKKLFIIQALINNEIVGVLPCFYTISCPRLEAHKKYVVKKPINIVGPTLLAQTFYSFYGGPVTEKSKREEDILTILIDRFEELAIELDVPYYGFINIPENKKVFLKLLCKKGFNISYLSSCMYLPVRFKSFSEYLESLPKNKRKPIKRRNNQFLKREGQCTILNKNIPWEKIEGLAKNTLIQHDHKDINLFPIEFIKKLKDNLKEKVKIFIVKDNDGRIIMHSLAFEYKKVLIPWFAGIDYKKMDYFEPNHAITRKIIEYAIDNKIKEIDMGRGSYNFKYNYGFKRRKLFFTLKTTKKEYKEEILCWQEDISKNALSRYKRQI